MRCALLVTTAILVGSTLNAWSQDDLPPLPWSGQGSGEVSVHEVSSSPQSGVPEAQSYEQTPSWTQAPLVDSSPYFANGNSAGYGQNGRVWASASVLLWGIRPGRTPPLVTNGTTTSLGAIGPGTSVIAGGNQNYNLREGALFTVGTWLDEGRTKGIEGSYFFLGGPSDTFSASSSGAPGTSVLARPFINAITGLEDSQIIGFPGVTGGNVYVSSTSQFQGAQINGLCNLCCSSVCDSCCSTGCSQTGYGQPGYFNQTGYRLDMIGGFQYLNLNENLVITENITVLPTAPPPFVPGSTIMVTDNFRTSNNFYGGQIGARGEWYRGAWFVNATGQVALGSTHQVVQINGSTVFTDPGGPAVTQPGGLLALPTNSGTFSRDRFSVVPTVGLNVGRQITKNVRVYVGYTLIYWSNVVRPGDQIDPVVNPTQLPTAAGPGTLVGPARPAFAFRETDFWAQGVNLGMAVNF